MTQGPPFDPNNPGYGGVQPPSGMPQGWTPPAAPQYSPDGRFAWNGFQWLPVMHGGGGGRNTPVIIAACLAIALLVGTVLIVISLTIAGKQVNNVFSNISNGLYFPPGGGGGTFSNIDNGLAP